MANGKIIYTPIPTLALSFDEAHYLSLASAAFNPGTGHLGVDSLLYIDPAVADSECWVAAKGALDLSSLAGWHFYYKPATRRLGLRLNDGGVTALVVETADNAIPALGNNFWARLEIDRTAALARFYVNGTLAAARDISAVTGSLDNAEPLKVGGYDASTNRHKGRLDFLRFDLDRLLPAAWHEEEWHRLRYGCSRRADFEDFLAVWTWYGQSLMNLGGDYELAWQGGGDPVYVTGWPGSAGDIEYLFEENYNYDAEIGYLELDDNQRLADQSAFNYPAPNQKKTFTLPFQYILPPQQAAFEAAWAAKQPLKLFLDADRPKEPGTYQLMKYPLQRYVFSSRMDAELDLEQT